MGVSYALAAIFHVGVLRSLTMCLCVVWDWMKVPVPAVLAPPQHRLGQVCVQHRGSPPAHIRCVSQGVRVCTSCICVLSAMLCYCRKIFPSIDLRRCNVVAWTQCCRNSTTFRWFIPYPGTNVTLPRVPPSAFHLSAQAAPQLPLLSAQSMLGKAGSQTIRGFPTCM